MAGEEAKKKAEAADSKAYQAKSEADKAKETADRAKRTAEEAKGVAEQAKKTADTTKQELGGLKSSLATATAAQTTATAAKALAEKINTLLKQSNLTVLSNSTPFLVATGKAQLTVKKGTTLTLGVGNDILVVSYTVDTRIDISSLSAGKDYYVYLVSDGGQSHKFVVSENSTYPRNYTVNNSRKIGGFHTLCADVGTISGHLLSGYRAGDILPHSVWCLNHRPYSSPEGMVYDSSTDLWVDIYLQSGTGENTKSVYRTNITTNRGYTEHATDMARVKKFLLSDEAFASAMYGSNEKTNLVGKKEPTPKVSGGYKDTANR
ncbi:alanine-zipper protein [Bartonella sp. B1099]|uniref:phage major tropism determinant n=1 Tax=Bartonella sp. B1099 TaxID=2911422 RepID=UPI0020C3D494|nr:alanine-zipper protein [Bartonella sp. B1099]